MSVQSFKADTIVAVSPMMQKKFSDYVPTLEKWRSITGLPETSNTSDDAKKQEDAFWSTVLAGTLLTDANPMNELEKYRRIRDDDMANIREW